MHFTPRSLQQNRHFSSINTSCRLLPSASVVFRRFMGSRIPSHQLSGGLYVSGRPEQYKERQPTVALRAMPYTGGDIKNSGELGKMFDIPTSDAPIPTKIRSSSRSNSGTLRSSSSSGQISSSTPKKSSGPLTLHPTGLITSGPIGSSSSRRSGQLDSSSSAPLTGKTAYGSSVTSLAKDPRFRFKVSKFIIWVLASIFCVGLAVGVFMLITVKRLIILIVVGGLFVPVFLLFVWNCCWKRKGLISFFSKYPDAELRSASDGQYVKVTGVVTCGSIPLETSYQRVPRCIYVSTELYEYRGWGGKPANTRHRHLSWGLRYSERHIADFYISDFQSGLRAQVKAGYGAKIACFVEPANVVGTTNEKKEFTAHFLEWLAARNLSSDDRIMRLKEGYIKEGNTVSVIGMVRRHDNVLMIVPPTESISTGYRWLGCLFPINIESLIVKCDENQNDDAIPV